MIYVANKADSPKAEAEAVELYRLGMERLIPISALHGRGISDLEMAIEAALPAKPAAARGVGRRALRIAIIGRPNAGKSSLVNRIAGEERMLVDATPGTTRDPIDTLAERDGKRFLLIDTAGIRRKSKVTKEDSAVEAVSVIHAIRAMERAEVVLLLCDAAEGVAEQDAKILGLAVDRGCGVVIGLNKIDLLDRKTLAKAEQDARDKLSFVPWAPIAHVSARSGRGVAKLIETVAQVADAYRKRVPTGELNRFFEQILLTHPPPTHGGRAPRLFFVTQAETSPPLFVVVASDPDKLHFSYRRYVANQLRRGVRAGGRAGPCEVQGAQAARVGRGQPSCLLQTASDHPRAARKTAELPWLPRRPGQRRQHVGDPREAGHVVDVVRERRDVDADAAAALLVLERRLERHQVQLIELAQAALVLGRLEQARRGAGARAQGCSRRARRRSRRRRGARRTPGARGSRRTRRGASAARAGDRRSTAPRARRADRAW